MGELGESFKRCVDYREATADLLDKYDQKFDFIQLGKMAIDYSDGVVQASPDVNADLLSYVAEKNVPLLPYPGETGYGEAYADFYNKLTE